MTNQRIKTPKATEQMIQTILADMEEYMQSVVDESGKIKPDASIKFQALDQLIKASMEKDQARAKAMLEQAILLDPLCLDAYYMRAQIDCSITETIRWYHQGLAAAEEDLKKRESNYQDTNGTIPSYYVTAYRRLQFTYYLTLIQAGIYDRALKAGVDILAMNPLDPLGILPSLVSLYLMEGEDRKAMEQIRIHRGEHLAYQVALSLYYFKRRQTNLARKYLLECDLINPHFLRYLSGNGEKEIAELTLDGYYEKVSKEEAYYALTDCYFIYDLFPQFLDFTQQIYTEKKQ